MRFVTSLTILALLCATSCNKVQVPTPEVNVAQVKEIAQLKLPDLNANDIDAAMRIIEGTARSMGIEVEA